jgi:hypothetical protein
MNRMTACIAAAATAAAVFLCAAAQAQGTPAGKLPTTSAESLAGEQLTLPADLPAERTLVLLAFERDQRASLATWKAGLDLPAGKTPWMELIVVGPENAFVRTMVQRGLRREIPEGPMRDRVLPLFAEQEAFAASLGLSTKSPHVLTVDSAGHVLAQADGDYAPGKAQALLLSLKP